LAKKKKYLQRTLQNRNRKPDVGFRDLSLSFSFFEVGGVRPFFYCFCAAKAKVISIETNFVALSLDGGNYSDLDVWKNKV
jgi:hypothetical protein